MPESLAGQLRRAAAALAAGRPAADLPSLLLRAAAALKAPAAPAFAGDCLNSPLADVSAAAPLAAAPGEVIILEADGGSRGNPGPAGCGVVLKDGAGNVVGQFAKFLGRATNNVAEYQGLLLGLEEAFKLNPSSLQVKLDSELLVKQLNGLYQVKSPHLRPLYQQARTWLDKFQQVSVAHVPRRCNQQADNLANQAMDRGRD
jgi:ribonuclease HI